MKRYSAKIEQTRTLVFEFDEEELEGGTPEDAALELQYVYDRDWDVDSEDVWVTVIEE